MTSYIFFILAVLFSTNTVKADEDFQEIMYLYSNASVDTSNGVAPVLFGSANSRYITYWNSDSIAWKYNLNGYSLEADSTGAYIDSCFTVWSNSTPDIFDFTDGNTTNYTLDPGNGNVIFFEDTSHKIDEWGITNIPGSTFLTTTNNVIQNVDICLNTRDFKFTYYLNKVNEADSTIYLQRIVTHEIGHMLGVSHYGVLASDIMNASDKYETSYGLNNADQFAIAYANEGRISSNMTFDNLVSTIFMGHQNISIDENVTLAIEKAATNRKVEFFPNISLNVNGTLHIVDSDIELSSSSDWSGININSNGTFDVDNDVTIEYATIGVDIRENSSTPISNSGNTLTIKYCTTGMNIYKCSPTVQNIYFDNITNDAIVIDYLTSDPDIDKVTINDAEYGIDIHSGADATFTDSIIEEMDEDNIYFENSAGIDMNGGDNDIYRTSGKYAIDNARPSTTFINVSSNFWDDETDVNVLFSDPSVVTCSSFDGSANNFGVYKPAVFAKRDYPLITARDYENIGAWEMAMDVYKDIIKSSDNFMEKRMSFKRMVRIYEIQDFEFDDIVTLMKDKQKNAKGWYRAYLDCALCDIMLKDGKYQDAIQELESRSKQYSGTSIEVMMLAEIANIYGNRLGDKESAKRYADMAAAINPGQSVLSVAYDAACVQYDPAKYKHKFRHAVETFDIQPEPKDEPDTEKITQFVSVTPNPANPATTITYLIAEPSNVKLVIYSVSGQKVATLVDGHMIAGKHAATFDGYNLASGVYFYSFESKGFTKTGKMLLIK